MSRFKGNTPLTGRARGVETLFGFWENCAGSEATTFNEKNFHMFRIGGIRSAASGRGSARKKTLLVGRVFVVSGLSLELTQESVPTLRPTHVESWSLTDVYYHSLGSLSQKQCMQQPRQQSQLIQCF